MVKTLLVVRSGGRLDLVSGIKLDLVTDLSKISHRRDYCREARVSVLEGLGFHKGLSSLRTLRCDACHVSAAWLAAFGPEYTSCLVYVTVTSPRQRNIYALKFTLIRICHMCRA